MLIEDVEVTTVHAYDATINNKGAFTIEGNSKIIIRENSGFGNGTSINNSGVVTVNDGTIYPAHYPYDGGWIPVYVSNYGLFEINGGNVENYSIYNYPNGRLQDNR